ncbi:hypothetical protein AB7872_13900 [Rhodanobacter denitrificans]|uniref:hypothetical protein n=1 Tax=Rhodanobacter sp. FW106-PBR-LB-1-21 TaxID=3454842 RepID=UPI0034E498FB
MPGRRPASRPYRHPRAIVIARPQRVPPQQTSPSPDPAASPARGLVPLAAAERALLQRRRWREPGREYRWHGPALLVALLLHALFALVVWQQMRPRPPAMPRASRDEVLEVRFVTSAPPAPAVPTPPAPPAASRPPTLPRHEPPARNAMTLQAPAPPPTPRLYDQQGQPLLPAPAASAHAPDYVPNLPRDDARIMQHRSPVEYRATRFDKDWGGGNAFDSALQKLVDKTTVKQTIRLPRGVHPSIAAYPSPCWPAAAAASRRHRPRRKTATSASAWRRPRRWTARRTRRRSRTRRPASRCTARASRWPGAARSTRPLARSMPSCASAPPEPRAGTDRHAEAAPRPLHSPACLRRPRTNLPPAALPIPRG